MRFDEMDKVEQGMSGVGGELGEMEDLLSVMKQARQDFNDEKSATRKAANAREAAKEQLGAEIREQAMHRRNSLSPGDDAGSSSNNLEPSPTKKRTHRDAFHEPFEDDIAIFTRAIRQGDEARNRAEEARLLLDRERFEEERKERQMDREERKEERAEASRLELEKFKMLIGAFKKES